MKGFRQQPETSRKERLRAIEAELQNLQMSQRISQMLLKQLMDSMQNIKPDMGHLFGLIRELQYKVLAMQQVSGLDADKLNEAAAELNLKDFNEASNREDAEDGLIPGDLVENDSIVVITTIASKNPEKSIFRSRLKLSECGIKDLIDGLMGRPVGAKLITVLNGEEHEVELLAIRNLPPKAALSEALEQTELAVQPAELQPAELQPANA